MRLTRDELETTTSELEKQRALNEKLENDLLQLNKHEQNGDQNGGSKSPDGASDDDILAGLDLGKKLKSGTTSVGYPEFEMS